MFFPRKEESSLFFPGKTPQTVGGRGRIMQHDVKDDMKAKEEEEEDDDDDE